MENRTVIKTSNFKHNWKLVKLNDICDVRDGTHDSPKYQQNGYPLVTSKNIKGNSIDFSDVNLISKEDLEQINKRSLVENGDILMPMIGTIGNPIIVKKDREFGIKNVALIKFKEDSQINKIFLRLILSSDEINSQFTNQSNGSSQKFISLGFIRNIRIPLPPFAEQKKIAEILSTWDKSIETTEKLIAAKQKLKKSLMQRLLTGSQRFPEFHGQEWKEVRLKDVFSEIRNINDGGDSHSVMTISARRGLISQQDKFNRVIAGDSLKKYTQLKRGDFAYNKGNSKTYEMGCIYQLESKESALVPFVYICFSPSEKVFSGFYKHWFLAHHLDRQLKKIITSGARGDGLLNVNSEDFFKLKITLPPLEEQKKIAAVLNSCDAEINVLQTKLAALRQQKRGLMQKLLTGRVRVKLDENSNAAFEN